MRCEVTQVAVAETNQNEVKVALSCPIGRSHGKLGRFAASKPSCCSDEIESVEMRSDEMR